MKISEYCVNNKKKILTICLIFVLSILYVSLNYSGYIAVSNKDNTSNMDIVLGGETVGIKLLATGVLVMGVDREDTQVKIADVILKVNGNKIESNSELINFAEDSKGEKLDLEINRKGKIINVQILPLLDQLDGKYKLGLWVKDSSAGVGTITFYDRNSLKFGALGHAVTETKENYILPITNGAITKTSIYSIKKGVVDIPGELKGTITNNVIGEIIGNSSNGIYGKVIDKDLLNEKKNIQILDKNHVKEGRANIYLALDSNGAQPYEINIEKLHINSNSSKNMIISITDKQLLEKTGGIIQGMSGSPIIQDGKLVGAVTHVFLNDPKRGYGVFVQNMIEDMNSIE